MKHTHLLTTGLLLVSTLLMAETKYLSKEKIAELSKSSKFLSNNYTRIIEGIDEKDTYFLNLQYKGKIVKCFIDKKTGTIYKGDRYDASGKVSKYIKSPEQIKKLTKSIKDGVSFSYGTGKKDLYLFTDPECPYCIKFEKKAKGLLDEYTVHVILFPLRFHKKAPAMTEWIMQGANDKEKHQRAEALMVDNNQDYKAFLSTDSKKPFKYTDTIQVKLDKGKNAARLLMVTGTPIVFDAQFNKVNWGKLLTDESSKKNKSIPKK